MSVNLKFRSRHKLIAKQNVIYFWSICQSISAIDNSYRSAARNDSDDFHCDIKRVIIRFDEVRRFATYVEHRATYGCDVREGLVRRRA